MRAVSSLRTFSTPIPWHDLIHTLLGAVIIISNCWLVPYWREFPWVSNSIGPSLQTHRLARRALNQLSLYFDLMYFEKKRHPRRGSMHGRLSGGKYAWEMSKKGRVCMEDIQEGAGMHGRFPGGEQSMNGRLPRGMRMHKKACCVTYPYTFSKCSRSYHILCQKALKQIMNLDEIYNA